MVWTIFENLESEGAIFKVVQMKCILLFVIFMVKYLNILMIDDVCDLVLSYWANLKLWFKQKISKEEFDLEARRLLAQENGNLVP